MGSDGTASLTELRSGNDTRASPALPTSSKPKQTPSRRETSCLTRSQKTVAKDSSSESSQNYLKSTQASKRKVTRPVSGKARLPWLDGSPSRWGSIPPVPGAFQDDTHSTAPNANLSAPSRDPPLSTISGMSTVSDPISSNDAPRPQTKYSEPNPGIPSEPPLTPVPTRKAPVPPVPEVGTSEHTFDEARVTADSRQSPSLPPGSTGQPLPAASPRTANSSPSICSPKSEPVPLAQDSVLPPKEPTGAAASTVNTEADLPPNSEKHSNILFGHASETSQVLPESSLHPNPVPLIAMARELYNTDSSAFSDSEASIRGSRQRVLDDAMPQNIARLSLSIQSPTTAVRSLEDHPSPKANVGVDAVPAPPAARTSSFVPPDLPRSLTIQPIRSKKVTMTPDDLPNDQGNRKHSISVQPLKSRTTSKALCDVASPDNSKRSSSKSQTTTQPAGQELQASITGLEHLMQDALRLAEDAAKHGNANEVPAILDEARYALHRASVAQGRQELELRMARGDPETTFSPPCSGSSSQSSSMSKSVPRLTTAVTERPQMHKSPSSTSSGPKTVWDEDWPYHRVESPSAVVDWAYKLQRQSSASKNGRLANNKSQQGPLSDAALQPNAQGGVSVARQRLPSKAEVQEYIKHHNRPPLIPRFSSLLQTRDIGLEGANSPGPTPASANIAASRVPAMNTALPGQGEPNTTSMALGKSPTQDDATENWGRDKFDEKDFVKTTDMLKGKHHVTLKEGEHFSIHHGHVRQPIARNWSALRKRFTAVVACFNTALIGLLIGIYAGEVPAIQYTLADTMHRVILGNVCLYIGMAITTFVCWPLPLLHGRKPYTLIALGLALPLQIPQAIIVSERRTSVVDYSGFIVGLLISRGILGLALGFAHINFKSTLLDLYGASLQSEFPHGETVIIDDVRRHGGGMGYWLGIWSFCFIGSLALGFLVGADIVSGLNVSWGFYISVILIAIALFLTLVSPETRRSPHRRTMQEVELPNDGISRRVARGEIKLHVSGDGPKWWWEEVFAGLYLSFRMLAQSSFLVMALYFAWIYAQIVLIIVLLGNLLSVEYAWRPEYVGLGVFAVAVGAFLAVPNSKANFFSRSRIHGPRTDSMTFQPRFTWTSHCVRRFLFMITLPIAGLAYTLASKGASVQYMVPIFFAGFIGYISNLAIAECNGIIMENFDTSDLQPGTNSRHRLQSLAVATKRRRTTYSSYPRVSAGFFASQSLGFLFAAAATGVGGAVTRTVGAQKATAITASILLGLTLLLVSILFRFRVVQVIPNELFGSYFGPGGTERKKSVASISSDKSWRAVVIGNPSGKLRRMNWLELGSLSRWTEIRRLNRLLTRSTTQALNPGWQ